jgi:hypothetical protein
VPGGYFDAMSASTKLGKAVRAACAELGTLGALEAESLAKTQALLARLGVKADLAPPPVPEWGDDDDEEEVDEAEEEAAPAAAGGQ